MTEENRKRAGYLILAALLVLIVLYFRNIVLILLNFWGIIIPLVGGCVLAYFLNIIAVRIEKLFFPHSANKMLNRIRPMISVLLSVVLVAVVLFLIINLVVPELVNALLIISDNIPAFINKVIDNYGEIEQSLERIFGVGWTADLFNNKQQLRDQILGYATKGISGIVNSASAMLSGLGSAIFSFFITFSFAIYILSGKKRLARQAKMVGRAFISEKWRIRLRLLLKTADETFSSFIVGQLTEAVILGSLCMAGMMLLRIPYATAVGVFIGATALIPIFGAWIGAAIGLLLILAVNPIKAVLFLVFILILQQAENNLIYPRVVGTSIGLPGIWVLAAITVGSGLGGIVGMMVSVPLTATAYKLFCIAVKARLESSEQNQSAEVTNQEDIVILKNKD